MKSKQDIFVYADWVGLSEPTLVGIWHAQWLRGKELFWFEYVHFLNCNIILIK